MDVKRHHERMSGKTGTRKPNTSDKKLYCWSANWQMLFNADKCKTLHFGYNNINSDYSLGNEVIRAYDEERDLGVIVICQLYFEVEQSVL